MADYDIQRFGREKHPVVIIDNFSPDFDRIVEASRKVKYHSGGPHYPGLRTPFPIEYLQARMGMLKEIFTDVFNMGQGLDVVNCAASIIATPPQDLTPFQRLPHIDTTDPGRIALLHYCDGPERGGTAFYRHRGTGFESISQARHPEYTKALEAEVRKDGLPKAKYMTDSNDWFEKIGEIEARPNRMAIYRSMVLHSGVIPDDLDFSGDPKAARLTINTFLQARAAS